MADMMLLAGGKKAAQLQIQVGSREPTTDEFGNDLPFGIHVVEEILSARTS